ncbi:MAG: hypothetical protein WCH31_02770 [Actinomycetes bacterium]
MAPLRPLSAFCGVAAFALLAVAGAPGGRHLSAVSLDIPAQTDIAVSLQGGPPNIGNVPTDGLNCQMPSTSSRPPFTIKCPLEYSYRESGVTMNGSATWLSEAKSGTFAMTCDWDISVTGTVTVDVSATGVSGDQVISLAGIGSQPCSWAMAFGGGTALNGTLEGRSTIGLASPSTGFFRGEFTVTVVAGTGDFARANGGGSFTEYQEFSFAGHTPAGAIPSTSSIPSGGSIPSIPSGIPTGLPTGAMFGTLARSSAMHLHLKAGAPSVALIVPPHVTVGGSYALHAATAPGAACKAAATQGAKKVDLGKATAAKRNGNVLFPGHLGSKLRSGSWSLTASCVVGGTTVTDKAVAKIVAR